MSEVVEIVSPKEQYLSSFPAVETAGNNHLAEMVTAAKNRLEQLEVPTTRQEYWKYTRIASWLKPIYNDTKAETVSNWEPYQTEGLEVYDLVFVNGKFVPEQSTLLNQEKITAIPLSQAWESHAEVLKNHLGTLTQNEDHFFVSANAAHQNSGVFIHVADGQALDKPVRILQITNGKNQASHPRHLMVFGKNANAKVIQRCENARGETCFTNSVIEVFVAENAHVEYCLLQKEGEQNGHIHNTYVQQLRDSVFSIFTLSLSGKLLRNNLNILVKGQGCETNLNGLYLTKGKEHVDNHTLVDHLEPNCNSNELYKGIMNEKSTGVFNGKVFVRQKAQKTNAFQSNQNILLSDDASINSKPELEIYADDVKCSHGSTTGQFDEEAVFYLQSRGIGEESARKLLIKAFASDVLETMSIEALKEQIENYISDRYDNAIGS